MASFVPYYRKKILALKGKEDKLRRSLANGASELKLLIRAADVRDARIRVMRAKLAQRSPADTDEYRHAVKKTADGIAMLLATSPAGILAEFGYCHTSKPDSDQF